MPEDRGKKTIWISHRGYTANAVENTYAAFKAAVDIGFTFLETDLRTTRDQQIVLIHDDTLNRLANDNRRVIDLTRKEVFNQCQHANPGGCLRLDEFRDPLQLPQIRSGITSACRSRNLFEWISVALCSGSRR